MDDENDRALRTEVEVGFCGWFARGADILNY